MEVILVNFLDDVELGGVANILDDRARKQIFSCYIHPIASGFQDLFFRIHCIWHLGLENQKQDKIDEA